MAQQSAASVVLCQQNAFDLFVGFVCLAVWWDQAGYAEISSGRVTVFWCVGSVNYLPTEIVHAIRLIWLGATFVYFYD
jgi:hypothetical protein